MINKIWDNRKAILEGLKNNLFKKEHVEEISSKRLDICKNCPFYSTASSGCTVPGTEPCCSNCGCSLALKTRALSASCPINKWEAILSEKEVEDNYKKIYGED